ncbi:peptidyl-prolyl cis-trans isomerase [Fictibacillus sp. Mic-4]|uniref:hypothetical protein n=1 Tax=Fictibacillus TaxID=1329200 RepID=UPI00040FA5BF|nr:hypothetical protein [Fictibacillus gelatini]
MSSILMIKGNVKYTITLDPGLWIFDDRKIDMDTVFLNGRKLDDSDEKYLKDVSSHWDREIKEGARLPENNENKQPKTYLKETLLTGSFGIPFAPFLKNAEPLAGAKYVVLETEGSSIEVPLDEAMEAILAFSKEGKPLKEDGPVHFYYGDGRNKDNPIKNIKGFIVK